MNQCPGYIGPHHIDCICTVSRVCKSRPAGEAEHWSHGNHLPLTVLPLVKIGRLGWLALRGIGWMTNYGWLLLLRLVVDASQNSLLLDYDVGRWPVFSDWWHKFSSLLYWPVSIQKNTYIHRYSYVALIVQYQCWSGCGLTWLGVGLHLVDRLRIWCTVNYITSLFSCCCGAPSVFECVKCACCTDVAATWKSHSFPGINKDRVTVVDNDTVTGIQQHCWPQWGLDLTVVQLLIISLFSRWKCWIRICRITRSQIMCETLLVMVRL